MIGTQLGKYHVTEALGEGGMAAVYKGFDVVLRRDVAIKVILRGFEKKEVFAKRFEREAMAVAQLTHPNIVQVIDYGEQDGIPYLIMEYISGGTLKDFIRGQPIPWKQAAEMLAPVARALDYAHKEKIVHRDIKPANLLLTKTGDLMLSDFGIAKLLGDDQISNLTGTGVGIGTPAYMAPEQGMGKTIDPRVDIYSLGVVFYEMITGRPPYEADTPIAVMLKHINAPLPRPKQFVSDIPDRVEQVLFKALAKNPDHRYQSMEELAEALENLVRKTEEVVRPAKEELQGTIPVYPPKAIERPAWLVWIMVAFVLVCIVSAIGIVAGGGYLWSRQATPTRAARKEKDTPTPTVLKITPQLVVPSQPAPLTPSQEAANSPSETPLLSDTPSPSPTVTAGSSWKQGKLAFVARNGEGNSLYVLDLTQETGPSLIYDPGGSTKLMAPAWSPDARLIAFEEYAGNLQVVDGSGAGRRSLRPCRGPSWSADGEQILCYAAGTDSFDILEVDTGRVARRIEAPAGGIFPALSPLGDYIVFPAFEGDITRIWRMSLDGSLLALLAAESTENYAPSWSPDGMWIAYQSKLNSQLSDIWIMDQNGENTRRITDTSGEKWSRAPSWSPDGRWLAFVSDQSGSFGADYGEIFIVSLETGEIIQITETRGMVYDWRVSWGK